MTNASNQDQLECSTIYNPNAAFEFFKLVGSLESAKAGQQFFVRGQKAGLLSFLHTDKTYLLVDGKVAIQTVSGNTVYVESGDIFGEFTPYSVANATATACDSCKLLSVSEKQLMTGFKKKPEFLFMLMGVLANYLQNVSMEKERKFSFSAQGNGEKDYVLNSKMLDELKQILGDAARTSVPEKRVVFQKGAAAALMYVILDGHMAITVADKVIDRVGPGCVVGEIALATSQHSRTASVIAETRCSLLAITRQSLLSLVQDLPAFGISLLRVFISRLQV